METPTTSAFDTAFASLLASWNHHCALKDQQAPLHRLWTSHRDLEDNRRQALLARAS